MKQPTQRSLELLRKLGYAAQVVERWNQWAKRRVDLFGCIDILAMHPEHGLLAVQATTATNLSARVAKCKAEPLCRRFVEQAGQFEIWSWAKRGERGKRKTWSAVRHRAQWTPTGVVFGLPESPIVVTRG